MRACCPVGVGSVAYGLQTYTAKIKLTACRFGFCVSFVFFGNILKQHLEIAARKRKLSYYIFIIDPLLFAVQNLKSCIYTSLIVSMC